MTVEADEIVSLRLFLEFLVEFFARKAEGYVHEGAVFLIGVNAVEAVGGVDRVVEELRLFEVLLVHRLKTALFLEPIGDELHDVNAERGRRVEHRVFFGEFLIGEH